MDCWDIRRSAGLERNPIQGAFPQPIYTRCWSRSRLAVPLSMIVDSTLISCLSWRALHPSSQVIRYRKDCRRVSHASCFSESVPSVSQSRFAIKRGKSLDFRLGRSRHSCNSPVHRSITRASSQHAHSERKKRSSWILFLNQNVYKLIPIHSVKVSTGPSTERCTMLIGIGKDLLVHVRQHSWQSERLSPEGMVWLCSWCCLIE
nr:hypothetical protein [Glycine max]